ncbi:LysR family transcriptional regulator [Pseudolabrys taiwanensis]|uniref:LysR family transcriptional regulator n=1 Tax=Pseudolabrys taiwanensis TaxID=331696 RepID=A0A346A1C1_9HYPH|nr:LysR substrate-binding domain-containing protein [Pseudolabrys taiwanensis]AXK82968.1 LysR family transcriptional regulator [Pseudolabrys taiwanensis]
MRFPRLHSTVVLYFDAVRRSGSIREAARRLNVASSAVNRQILQLEQDIGLPLFERIATGVRLTAAGEVFARHVLFVLQDAERLSAELDQLVGVHAGHVTVAAAEGICMSVMPQVITALRAKAPRITVSLRRTESLRIEQSLISGDVDLGVGFDLPVVPGLRQVFAAKFAIGVIMHPEHEMSRQARIPLSALLGYPLVLPEDAVSIMQFLAPAFARLNARPSPTVSTNSIDAIRALVESKVGIGIQTRFGIDRSLAEGTLVHVPLDAGGPVISTVSILCRAQSSLPAPVDLLCQRLGEELRARQEAEAGA